MLVLLLLRDGRPIPRVPSDRDQPAAHSMARIFPFDGAYRKGAKEITGKALKDSPVGDEIIKVLANDQLLSEERRLLLAALRCAPYRFGHTKRLAIHLCVPWISRSLWKVRPVVGWKESCEPRP